MKPPQVLLSGAVPIGATKNGGPKFENRKKLVSYKAAVLLSEYRAALR